MTPLQVYYTVASYYNCETEYFHLHEQHACIMVLSYFSVHNY